MAQVVDVQLAEELCVYPFFEGLEDVTKLTPILLLLYRLRFSSFRGLSSRQVWKQVYRPLSDRVVEHLEVRTFVLSSPHRLVDSMA